MNDETLAKLARAADLARLGARAADHGANPAELAAAFRAIADLADAALADLDAAVPVAA